MCTSQPFISVLDGQSKSPLLKRIGLFLMGPQIPSGKRYLSVQLLPLSVDEVTSPHQSEQFGPTL